MATPASTPQAQSSKATLYTSSIKYGRIRKDMSYLNQSSRDDLDQKIQGAWARVRGSLNGAKKVRLNLSKLYISYTDGAGKHYVNLGHGCASEHEWLQKEALELRKTIAAVWNKTQWTVDEKDPANRSLRTKGSFKEEKAPGKRLDQSPEEFFENTGFDKRFISLPGGGGAARAEAKASIELGEAFLKEWKASISLLLEKKERELKELASREGDAQNRVKKLAQEKEELKKLKAEAEHVDKYACYWGLGFALSHVEGEQKLREKRVQELAKAVEEDLSSRKFGLLRKPLDSDVIKMYAYDIAELTLQDRVEYFASQERYNKTRIGKPSARETRGHSLESLVIQTVVQKSKCLESAFGLSRFSEATQQDLRDAYNKALAKSTLSDDGSDVELVDDRTGSTSGTASVTSDEAVPVDDDALSATGSDVSSVGSAPVTRQISSVSSAISDEEVTPATPSRILQGVPVDSSSESDDDSPETGSVTSTTGSTSIDGSVGIEASSGGNSSVTSPDLPQEVSSTEQRTNLLPEAPKYRRNLIDWLAEKTARPLFSNYQ